jgi:hypothetical protein
MGFNEFSRRREVNDLIELSKEEIYKTLESFHRYSEQFTEAGFDDFVGDTVTVT